MRSHVTPDDNKAEGDRLFAARDYPAAFNAYRECLKRNPRDIGAALGMAGAARATGKLDVATQVLETALRFNPDSASLLGALGTVLSERWKQQPVTVDPATIFTSLRRAVELAPGSFEAAYNLANALLSWGDALAAIPHFRRAHDLRPDDTDCIGSLLSCLLYDPQLGGETLLRETRSLVSGGAPRGAPRPFPSRTGLRIGWLSSDLVGNHPVAQNTVPILRHLGPPMTHVVYASHPEAACPADIRPVVSLWRDVSLLDDQALAETIRQDGVDILIALAGRFDRNRPLFAQQRAAPIQLSLHDPATSGLAHVDGIILDRFLVPRAHRQHYTERPIRLPSFYTHELIRNAPDVGPLPMRASGTVTFGCFNKPTKINDAVLDLWARALGEIPNSRLVLKFARYRWAELRDRFLARLTHRGIDATRIHIRHEQPDWAAHMASYNEIDIALDPFPFSGSTTTFEALWMGVPVVTKPGELAVSRWTGSMLHALKLDRLIADGDDSYVAAIKELVEAPAELAALRKDLRDRVARSPLCNGAARARQYARLFRALHRLSAAG